MLEAAITALDRLAIEHPRAAEVARLRYLVGLEVRRIAAMLDISERTVGSDWVFARAWLRRRLSDA
jgi:DNA-directed RNA polymerase specialized sigma24 family protein